MAKLGNDRVSAKVKPAAGGGGGSAAPVAASPPCVKLIDFDDCCVKQHSITTLEDYEIALREYCMEQESWPNRPFSRTFAEEFVGGAFPQLRAALDSAFKQWAAASASMLCSPTQAAST